MKAALKGKSLLSKGADSLLQEKILIKQKTNSVWQNYTTQR